MISICLFEHNKDLIFRLTLGLITICSKLKHSFYKIVLFTEFLWIFEREKGKYFVLVMDEAKMEMEKYSKYLFFKSAQVSECIFIHKNNLPTILEIDQTSANNSTGDRIRQKLADSPITRIWRVANRWSKLASSVIQVRLKLIYNSLNSS